jgi:phosphomannomutase
MFDGSDLLFVLATYFHSQELLRGNTVIVTRPANPELEEALRCFGIQIIYTDRSDKDLEAAMWGGDYLLGGGSEGNIIINDRRHPTADAVYTALVLGGVLVRNWESDLGARANWRRTRASEV